MSRSKIRVSGELTWIIGLIAMAMGVALVSLSSFGYSMIAAPVYLIFKKLGVLSFGTVEYLYQGLLLVLLTLIIRRVRLRYLASFVTAVVYGLLFDLCLMVTSLIPSEPLAIRIAAFGLGEICIVVSVALFIHTDMAPEVYELFVKVLSAQYHRSFGSVKLIFDLSLLILSVGLSLALFGVGAFAHPATLPQAMLSGYVLEGIGIGTVIAAVINGPLIARVDRILLRYFDFQPSGRLGVLLRIE